MLVFKATFTVIFFGLSDGKLSWKKACALHKVHINSSDRKQSSFFFIHEIYRSVPPKLPE